MARTSGYSPTRFRRMCEEWSAVFVYLYWVYLADPAMPSQRNKLHMVLSISR